MAKFVIELNDTITVPLGDTGKVTVVPVGSFPESTIRFAVVQAFIGALNNISRGKDENDKPNSDDVWAAAREKRMNAWKDGDAWGSTTRESNVAPLKDAFVADMRAKYPENFTSDKSVEDHFASVVKETLGAKEKATFANWLLAIATQKSKANKTSLETERAALEGIYVKMAAERADARKAVTEKLDVSKLTFG